MKQQTTDRNVHPLVNIPTHSSQPILSLNTYSFVPYVRQTLVV